jgi:hypothetical protein
MSARSGDEAKPATPFEKFKDLARKLVSVPKKEADKKEADYQRKKRDRKRRKPA